MVERFGEGVVGPDGALDRPALAARVFEDDAARTDLEAITHPAIGEALLERVAAAPPDAVIVMDVPLLVEKGHRSYDLVLVVEAPLAARSRPPGEREVSGDPTPRPAWRPRRPTRSVARSPTW